MKKQTKKLQLSKETIAVLNDEKLAQVYGGILRTDTPTCFVTQKVSECIICTTDNEFTCV